MGSRVRSSPCKKHVYATSLALPSAASGVTMLQCYPPTQGTLLDRWKFVRAQPPLERAARAASCRTPRTSTPGVWASLGAWATETRATGRGFAGAGQGLLQVFFGGALNFVLSCQCQKWLVDIHPRLNSSNGPGTQKNHIQMWGWARGQVVATTGIFLRQAYPERAAIKLTKSRGGSNQSQGNTKEVQVLWGNKSFVLTEAGLLAPLAPNR